MIERIDTDSLTKRDIEKLKDPSIFTAEVLGIDMNGFDRQMARRLAETSRPGDFAIDAVAESANIIQQKSEEVAKNLVKQKERVITYEIDATDWDDTPILDIVFTRAVTDNNCAPSRDPASCYAIKSNYRAVRHPGPAPKMEAVGIRGESCDIYRLTRPLLERLREQYPEVDIPI